MTNPVLRITCEDLVTGDIAMQEIPSGEYVLIVTEPCHQANVTAHGNGTHVITVKGQTAR